jgi:hypothetical protein
VPGGLLPDRVGHRVCPGVLVSCETI